MRILFVTASAYLPESRGGMQSSANELCIGLKQRGHRVAVLGGFKPPALFDRNSRITIDEQPPGSEVRCDYVSGYRVWRTLSPWDALPSVAEREHSELIIAMSGQPVRMALAAESTRIPVLLLLQNVEFSLLGGCLRALGDIPCVANSQFTADRYRAAFGINPRVIYPVVCARLYSTERTRGNVTFINPIPYKGRDIALGIARLCPEIPFAFVESWRLFPENRQYLMNELGALPNVTLLPPQEDMRSIYSKCHVLLAPSVWEEGFGRVVAEAQISGIPAVASSRGGLPEAVGAGGVSLDPERPLADWAAAVRRLWLDDRHYDELSTAAMAHAHRREIDFACQIDAWESTIAEAKSSAQGIHGNPSETT